ncbi:MAG: hypothetical protein CGU28_11740 [Candidatus Dactylopiibacterium carminicum]|uniref:PepSY domain-containing protein n=1 Tax=Candidatus Dactylopiibacterium carminicum TaxID=857335 RepID=A0A272ET75_9RHOO|nr:hypothetical protein [Candidatus Dactylopiibacterium carminicum]KAF7599307.1 hypothetical protein BGI27_08500 [Candidatus Dactylopiibacterium carminicum]PAS93298.1 MAG: hypothetical protein CGU29_08150 [Candidatus Dactylopiibacterium carminicum]PAS95698.1 MAG: hypothetical protein CGU28_11740 [Candidatus Dactylopiibacterium carminicum]PAS99312.1 MAG: hypothetical protein BSR46_08530 [Candidatus Dactylopiibacterium carminicum]
MKKQLSIVAGVLGLVIASTAAQAAVTTKQVDNIQPGSTKAQVIAQLGKADWNPTWFNGKSSLVYSLSDEYNPAVRAYVDLDQNQKVVSVGLYDEQNND